MTIFYDEATDILTVGEMKFAGQLLRTWKNPTDRIYKFALDPNGAVIVQTIIPCEECRRKFTLDPFQLSLPEETAKQEAPESLGRGPKGFDVTLEDKIVHFVKTWGPDSSFPRNVFIVKLREIMSEYALAAIRHSNLPDVGQPHRPACGTACSNGDHVIGCPNGQSGRLSEESDAKGT
jgi:hypothetical protein